MAAEDTRTRSSRRQLPITGSAHKAGNGRRPLPAAIAIARSVRALRASAWLAERAGRPSAGRAISTSSSRCRPRSPTIACQNKAVVYDLLFRDRGRDDDDDRRRSQASRRPDRHHRRAAHLGLGDDASSACPHDRARRRRLARRPAVDHRRARLSSCRCGCWARSSVACFSTRLIEPARSRQARLLRRLTPILPSRRRFLRHLAPLRKKRWVVYAKAPFAGPEAVLAYLSRYTHRVAISNGRLIAFDESRRDLPLQGLSPRRPASASSVMTLDAARVHPPLPAACSAARLPPHPPLRLVRQRRAQGQHRPRPRTACRGVAAAKPVEAPRTARLAAALSLLRRAHAHHRDLRALDAAARAAPRSRSNRGAIVIRHGKRSRHAVMLVVPATAIHAPFARTLTEGLNIVSGKLRFHRPPGAKSRSPHPPRHD